MAMELFVLSDKQLDTVAEWQAAIASAGYPLRLADTTPMGAVNGFLPAWLRDAKTGFECSHWPADKFMREISNVDFGHDWKYLLTFRWGGDLNQVQAAWMAATAYARATQGIVFDDEEGKIRSVAEAEEIVKDVERDIPKIEAILHDRKDVRWIRIFALQPTNSGDFWRLATSSFKRAKTVGFCKRRLVPKKVKLKDLPDRDPVWKFRPA